MKHFVCAEMTWADATDSTSQSADEEFKQVYNLNLQVQNIISSQCHVTAYHFQIIISIFIFKGILLSTTSLHQRREDSCTTSKAISVTNFQ